MEELKDVKLALLNEIIAAPEGWAFLIFFITGCVGSIEDFSPVIRQTP
jgi:hypothetical protein